MTSFAERIDSLNNRRGSLATFSRDGTDPENYDPISNTWADGAPSSWSLKVGVGSPNDDDFQLGKIVATNPVLVYVQNVPAVEFAPAAGMKFTLPDGVTYTIAGVRPFYLDGVIQYWRVLGGL